MTSDERSTDNGSVERGERETLMFTLTERFKDAIGEYAQAARLSMSELVREAVAEKIGYDLKRDKAKRGRPAKYHNESEKKIASKRRSIERRALIKALTEVHQRQETEKQVAAVRASLVRKGIDPDA